MLTAAVGLTAAAGLGREAGMSAAWRWLSLATAAVALLGVVLPFFSVYPFDVLLVALVAGILVPAWVALVGDSVAGHHGSGANVSSKMSSPYMATLR
jgi:hypothetical protein